MLSACVPWFVTCAQPLGSLSGELTFRAVDGLPGDSFRENLITHYPTYATHVAGQC